MGEANFARSRHTPTPYQTGIGYTVMRGPERAFGDERPPGLKRPTMLWIFVVSTASVYPG